MRGVHCYLRQPRYLSGLVASLATMLLLTQMRSLRHMWLKVVLALLTGWVALAALAYFRYYHAPLDAQAVVAARHAWPDVYPVLRRAALQLGIGWIGFTGLELALLHGTTQYTPPQAVCRLRVKRRTAALFAVAAVATLTLGDLRRGTPEVRLIHAVWVVTTTRDHKSPDARLPMQELESTRPRLPNVLFIISESLRSSDACLGHGCTTMPQLDRLLPERITFTQARSVASYSAIALSALATGALQSRSRKELAQLPDFFDLAHAVRAGQGRYYVGYWSSQLAGVIERGPLALVADDVITAETLLQGHASDIEDAVAALLDRRLADYCVQRMPQLTQPVFVVLHLSGTHAPYAFEAATAQRKPWQRQVTWSGLTNLHRAYINAISEQDQSVGRCIEAFLAARSHQAWAIIYTSDHGEAFGEHGAIHHGQNLFDEQIRVPLVFAHDNGAVTPVEAMTLRHNATRAATHLDVLPTIVGLLGLDRHLALQAWLRALPGRNLLAPLGDFGQLPITNCTELFPCPINTWGVLAEHTKLIAQAWDGQWRCLSLGDDEREQTLAMCDALRKTACQHFGKLPNSKPDPGCAAH